MRQRTWGSPPCSSGTLPKTLLKSLSGSDWFSWKAEMIVTIMSGWYPMTGERKAVSGYICG